MTHTHSNEADRFSTAEWRPAYAQGREKIARAKQNCDKRKQFISPAARDPLPMTATMT